MPRFAAFVHAFDFRRFDAEQVVGRDPERPGQIDNARGGRKSGQKLLGKTLFLAQHSHTMVRQTPDPERFAWLRMASISKDAEWYIAELVSEITVKGEITNVVHRDLILVHAKSPEDAYEKALELGVASGASYDNPDGKRPE